MRLVSSFFTLGLLCFAGELKSDIEFARPGGMPLTLDAWVPDGKGPFPTVIVVHGGGWVNGNKQTYVTPLFDPLSKAGFTWFTINYRLAPGHHFPAQAEDTFTAIEWVKKHAKEYKADPKRIALMGESAGGQIVAYVGARGRGSTSVAAVVDFYGPHDLLGRARERGPTDPTLKLVGGIALDAETEKRLAEASPINYVHKGMPPFLFIHGTKDAAVPYNQSPMMCDKMKSVGVACEVYTVEDAPHGVGPWEKNPAWQTYKIKMVDWLRQTLR
ncbi:MAG: alpha/beta hydrolase [Acidobacteriia bacterium]|nr:alpha/beta hydrolase [Terriglobia bacterium]